MMMARTTTLLRCSRALYLLITVAVLALSLLCTTSNNNVLVRAESTDDLADCIPGRHDVRVDDDDSTTKQQAPEQFTVKFHTSASLDEPITLEIIRAWSPIGVDRFYNLMADGYYNCGAFFRVVPNFVIQFGLASEPEETKKWDTNIIDDPVAVQSNVVGTITYATAGPGTRTTQVFINLQDNTFLDKQGFTPFGKVIDGMDVLTDKIKNPTPNDTGGADQQLYRDLGNTWILQEYPTSIDIITKTEMAEE